MIAEAAYYLAQERGFLGGHSIDDWLTAEQRVRLVISPEKPTTEPVSVDATIDGIAREALEEARRVEAAEKLRKIPGPVIPPEISLYRSQ